MIEEQKAKILQDVKDEYAKEVGLTKWSDITSIDGADVESVALRFHSAMIEALKPSDEEIGRNAILFVNKFNLKEKDQRNLKLQYIGEIKALIKKFTCKQ